MWRVILKRGRRGEVQYMHSCRETAQRRANSLAVLHSCNVEQVDAAKTFIVDATTYYKES